MPLFLTAGQIIPVVTGKPWETFVKENIFAPLGMINTLALTADMPKSYNRTVPHTLIDGRLSTIPYAPDRWACTCRFYLLIYK